MIGARFVNDALQFAGWDVVIVDAAKVKGIAPLAAKTDKIDARLLAELARRALVPEITAADPGGPGGARAGPLLAPPRPPPDGTEEPDLRHAHDVRPPRGLAGPFGVAGHELLAGLALPEPCTTTRYDEPKCRIGVAWMTRPGRRSAHPDPGRMMVHICSGD